MSTKQSLIETISQARFEENILKYSIHSMISLRTVEDPYFSNIVFWYTSIKFGSQSNKSTDFNK